MSDMWNAMKEVMEHEIRFLRECHKQDDWMYTCLKELVLEQGIRFFPGEIPSHVEKMEYGLCFNNSLDLLVRDFNYVYVEGFACHQVSFPVHHGWIIHRDNPRVVIDPTWDFDPESCYVGIPLARKFIVSILNEDPTPPILDDWKTGFKLLKDGIPQDDIHPIINELR